MDNKITLHYVLKNLAVTLLVFFSSFSFGQNYSATDSVVVTGTTTMSSWGRGFRFTPNVNINIVDLGKRIPTTLGNYIWTIWNNNTNTIVHQQASTTTPVSGVYIYEPISSPVQLLQGVSYSIVLYCDATSGVQYYYGPSTQIDPQLTYSTAVYCNSCTENTNANSVVNGYHYGTPDFHFSTCTPGTSVDTRTECSGYTWINGNTYTSSNNTAAHSIPGASANGCDSIVYLDLTIIPTPVGIQTEVACDSFVWINGYTYTISTQIASHILPGASANGCDSLAKLHLTILNPKYGTDTRTKCQGYTWIDGNSYYSDTNSATYTIPGGASNGCDSIVTLNLTVTPVNVGLTVVDPTLTANAIGASYRWFDCGNGFSVISGANAQTYIPVTNGMYAAEITENGCVDTSLCTVIASAGFTKNSLFKEVSFSPNPTSGEVNFNFGNLIGLKLKVFNTAGKILYSEERIENNLLQIKLNESPGIYFIQLSTNEQNQVYKLVIQ